MTKQIIFSIALIGFSIAQITAAEPQKGEILTMKTIIARTLPLKRLLFFSPKIYEAGLYLKVGQVEQTYIADKTADGSIQFVAEDVKDLYSYIHYNHINAYRTNKPLTKELEDHVEKGTAIHCPYVGDRYHNGKLIPVGGILRNSNDPCDCEEFKKFIEQHKKQ
jgi:hypothetical protein